MYWCCVGMTTLSFMNEKRGLKLVPYDTPSIKPHQFIDPNSPPWYLIGLPPAAISLVFKAFYGFATSLDSLGVLLALFSSCAAVMINNDDDISPSTSQWIFPSVLALGGMVTWIESKCAKTFFSSNSRDKEKSPGKGWDKESDETMKRIGIPLWVGTIIFLVWLVVLVLVIVLVRVAKVENEYLDIFETMYRIGSLIFGGGQVVLPMLQDEVVPDWMTKDQFLQGLGLAQSMPGPLFNFAAYLGAVYKGVPGALVAYCGIFGPGVILIFAAVPFWYEKKTSGSLFLLVVVGVFCTRLFVVAIVA
jgi:chromate transporter